MAHRFTRKVYGLTRYNPYTPPDKLHNGRVGTVRKVGSRIMFLMDHVPTKAMAQKAVAALKRYDGINKYRVVKDKTGYQIWGL